VFAILELALVGSICARSVVFTQWIAIFVCLFCVVLVASLVATRNGVLANLAQRHAHYVMRVCRCII
jgi:uncharacterized membrane-anchored protein